MNKNKINYRGLVLTWTILTTTFFWTTTMRMIFKPEISAWSIFKFGGKGMLGEFWFPPLIAVIALFMFYLEGRGKLRTIYYVFLIGWHSLLTGGIIYGSLQSGSRISFKTWGIDMSFRWLILPFVLFLFLSVMQVVKEAAGKSSVPEHSWKKINFQPLLIAVILVPIVWTFFRIGTGFNWKVKIAVAGTIAQWIFLTESLGRPYLESRE